MKNIRLILFITSFFLLTTNLPAQPGNGGGNNGNPPPHAAPIGGIELLLLGGLALGVKKLVRKKDI